MQQYQIEEAVQAFLKTFQPYKTQTYIKLESLADGMAFAQILSSAEQISVSTELMDENVGKWIIKLGNLKKITKKLQTYVQHKLNKNVIVKDIDLIQIAKNQSRQDIIKFFELVIAVLMQSPYKQNYIQRIMSLDQKSQSTFVTIIQNSLQSRLCLSHQRQAIKLEDQVKILRQENQHLRDQIQHFSKTNKKQSQQIAQLKQKITQYSDELQTLKFSQIQKTNQNLSMQLNQQRNLTQNLKNKLISIAREHQTQISKLKEEISILQIKVQHTESLQNAVDMYKERYTETLQDSYKKGEWEKEKRKLVKQIQDKDLMIKKLNEKIQQAVSKTQNLEENQLYMKMELQKKQVRFKQLEKQVKTRLNCQTPNILPSTILQQSLQEDHNQPQLQQIEYMKNQIEKLRNSNRQLQRQNMKNKKKIQKITSLQQEKKKLQRMILQVSKSRDAQIQMLVVSLYDLRNENIKIYQILKEKQVGAN